MMERLQQFFRFSLEVDLPALVEIEFVGIDARCERFDLAVDSFNLGLQRRNADIELLEIGIFPRVLEFAFSALSTQPVGCCASRSTC